jgi:TorA maturation chaperone TorD
MTAVTAEDRTGPVPAEDRARGHVYGLLAVLLARPPDAATLAALAALRPEDAPDSPLEPAWRALREAALAIDPAQAEREYHRLFIGIGRGEVLPYASWYLTGYLMEQPLAALREDLARLGLAVGEGVHEPEDHAAALCEIMRSINERDDLGDQDRYSFFQVHVDPWMGRFFEDLEQAESARLYRAVGGLGRRFLDLERTYFDLPA